MSKRQWNGSRGAVEALEPRKLLAAVGPVPESDVLRWPLQGAGMMRVGRTLYIRGTDGDDRIGIGFVSAPPPTSTNPNPEVPREIRISFNTTIFPLQPSFAFKRVLIAGMAGNDRLDVATNLHPSFKPKLIIIRGGLGDDIIQGGRGSDYILGEQGNDVINGFAGKDRIDGGLGNDTITGGDGPDVLIGRDGDDTFHNGEGALARGEGLLSPRDEIFGGDGADSAVEDPADIYDGIETRRPV